MLAMQYSFTLPSDYDMAKIRERIAGKGHMTDDFPQLAFKAYLLACRDEVNPENLYAPFYLWESPDGMNNFLGGRGFVGLTQSFGWPSIKTWSVWRSHLQPDIAVATHATREIVAIQPFSPLDVLRRDEAESIDQDIANSAVGAVSAFEPTTWTLVRFRLWTRQPEPVWNSGWRSYEVGHLSLPGGNVN